MKKDTMEVDDREVVVLKNKTNSRAFAAMVTNAESSADIKKELERTAWSGTKKTLYLEQYFRSRFEQLQKKAKKLISRKSRTRQRRITTYTRHQSDFVEDFLGKDVMAFLIADPMSDEEDYRDENGSKYIKRLRPNWRSMDANAVIDRLDMIFLEEKSNALMVPRHPFPGVLERPLTNTLKRKLPSWCFVDPASNNRVHQEGGSLYEEMEGDEEPIVLDD